MSEGKNNLSSAGIAGTVAFAVTLLVLAKGST